MMPPPLAGLRALDLTDALGYLCGRLLADLGALVIKVEPPGGDPGRALGPRYRAPDGREHGLYWHAMNAGKLGTTLAHLARGRSGRGQHVVVNAQAAMVWTLMNAQAFPVLHGDHLRRSGPFVGSRGVRRRMVFPCADGHVSLLLMGAQGAPSTRALMRWMDEHGRLPAWLRDWPWEQWEPGWAMEASPAVQAEMVRIEEAVEAFLRTRTKAEVYREAVRRRILVAPVATVADIAADPQLAFREYFRPVDDDVLGRRVRYPGPFARLSATPLAEPRRPPEPGEHNPRVWGELCGYDVDALRRAGII